MAEFCGGLVSYIRQALKISQLATIIDDAAEAAGSALAFGD